MTVSPLLGGLALAAALALVLYLTRDPLGPRLPFLCAVGLHDWTDDSTEPGNEAVCRRCGAFR